MVRFSPSYWNVQEIALQAIVWFLPTDRRFTLSLQGAVDLGVIERIRGIIRIQDVRNELRSVPGHFQHRQHEGLVPGHGVECAPRAEEILPVDPFKQPRIETPEVGGTPVILPKGIRLGNLVWYGSGVPWDRGWPGRILAIRHPTVGLG